MSERSWPDLPIGRIELTAIDRNRCAKSAALRTGLYARFRAETCRLNAGWRPRCPQNAPERAECVPHVELHSRNAMRLIIGVTLP